MTNCQTNMRYARRQNPGFFQPEQSACNTACTPVRSRVLPSPATPVAMAYVPRQTWRDIYEPCKALECGTLFCELNKPFTGKGGRCR